MAKRAAMLPPSGATGAGWRDWRGCGAIGAIWRTRSQQHQCLTRANPKASPLNLLSSIRLAMWHFTELLSLGCMISLPYFSTIMPNNKLRWEKTEDDPTGAYPEKKRIRTQLP